MNQEESTRELLEKTRAGDREAFDQLVVRYRTRLIAYIRTRMGQNVRARLDEEDLLQETFVCVTESIDKFRWQGEASFFSWLSSIAEHLIRNASRKRGLHHLGLDRDVTSSKTSPSKAMMRDIRFNRLEQALNSLEKDQGRALRMARIDGMKVKEIATEMNRSPDSVKKLLARALVQLKRAFGDTDSLHLPQRTFKKDEEQANE